MRLRIILPIAFFITVVAIPDGKHRVHAFKVTVTVTVYNTYIVLCRDKTSVSLTDGWIGGLKRGNFLYEQEEKNPPFCRTIIFLA